MCLKDGVVTSPSPPKTVGPVFLFIVVIANVNIADLKQFATQVFSVSPPYINIKHKNKIK